MTDGAREARARAQKDWLKRLAVERRDAWMIAVRPSALDGATRIRTKHHVIHLEDGVVIRVVEPDGETPVESPLVGMCVAGWVGDEDVLLADYRPGARVVLWRRPDSGAAEHTALALTGRVFAFGARRARTGPPRSRSPRSSSPGLPRSGVRVARPTT